MAAYFDFFVDRKDSPGPSLFAKAREVVKKYENYPIQFYRNMFKKIRDQLSEIDEVTDSVIKRAQGAELKGKQVLDPEANEQVSDSQKQEASKLKKKSVPLIHSILIDDNSGQLTITSENIAKFKVKYYLIDAEILFSRSPFVKDQAEQFSYVKPFDILELDSNATGETKVELPSSMHSKNVVIEIDSGDIQMFKTFYSSKLKINMIEDFGEIKVFNKETNKALPKTYVKVFCKNKSGSERFYRDGYTDIRGKFAYANASGKSLSDVSKFSILVSHDTFG